MGNNKQIKIEPIASNSFAGLEANTQTSQKINKKEVSILPTRISVDVYQDLSEMIKDYAYNSGMTQKEVIVHILEQHFSKNKPKERPKEVRERADQRIDRRRRKYKI